MPPRVLASCDQVEVLDPVIMLVAINVVDLQLARILSMNIIPSQTMG